MSRIAPVSRLTGGVFSAQARRRAAAVALCVATAALSAACSSGSPAAGSGSAAQTAQHALTLAAARVRQLSSLAGSISVQPAGDSGWSGTVQMQLRPSLLMDVNRGDPGAAGFYDSLSGTDLYLRIADDRTLSEVPLSELPGSPYAAGSALPAGGGVLLGQQIQNGLNANLLAQTQILATSKLIAKPGVKLVHKVSTQVISGVNTTEYAGAVSPSAALSALPASERADLAPYVALVTGDISFSIWIDAQHMVRKLTETELTAGSNLTQTMTVTSVNQPVTVTNPASNQALVLSAGDLARYGL